jgi:hypothetical protein
LQSAKFSDFYTLYGIMWREGVFSNEKPQFRVGYFARRGD